jgi:hypothetical protein
LIELPGIERFDLGEDVCGDHAAGDSVDANKRGVADDFEDGLNTLLPRGHASQDTKFQGSSFRGWRC